MIAASLADNYNGIVRAVRGNPSLQRDVASLSDEAGKRDKAGGRLQRGRRPAAEDRQREAPRQAVGCRQSRHDARQERRADLHGQGAGRLRERRDVARAPAG